MIEAVGKRDLLLRSAPSVSMDASEKLPAGTVVEGFLHELGSSKWLRTASPEDPARWLWLLVDDSVSVVSHADIGRVLESEQEQEPAKEVANTSDSRTDSSPDSRSKKTNKDEVQGDPSIAGHNEKTVEIEAPFSCRVLCSVMESARGLLEVSLRDSLKVVCREVDVQACVVTLILSSAATHTSSSSDKPIYCSTHSNSSSSTDKNSSSSSSSNSCGKTGSSISISKDNNNWEEASKANRDPIGMSSKAIDGLGEKENDADEEATIVFPLHAPQQVHLRRLSKALSGCDVLVRCCPSQVSQLVGIDDSALAQLPGDMVVVDVASDFPRCAKMDGDATMLRNALTERLASALKLALQSCRSCIAKPSSDELQVLQVSLADLESKPSVSNAVAALATYAGRVQVPVDFLPTLAASLLPGCKEDQLAATSYTSLRRQLSATLKAKEVSASDLIRAYPQLKVL